MKLKVAMVQYDTVAPDIDFNTGKALSFMKEAKENGADIVLFPECFLTAYWVPDIYPSAPANLSACSWLLVF